MSEPVQIALITALVQLSGLVLAYCLAMRRGNEKANDIQNSLSDLRLTVKTLALLQNQKNGEDKP